MDTLFTVIISGMAVAYATEFVSSLLERLLPTKLLKLILTLPLAYLAAWELGLTGSVLIVAGPAAAFFSLATLLLLNRPVTIQTVNRR